MEIEKGFILKTNFGLEFEIYEVYEKYLITEPDESSICPQIWDREKIFNNNDFQIINPKLQNLIKKGTLVYCWNTSEKPEYPEVCYSNGTLDGEGNLEVYSGSSESITMDDSCIYVFEYVQIVEK